MRKVLFTALLLALAAAASFGQVRVSSSLTKSSERRNSWNSGLKANVMFAGGAGLYPGGAGFAYAPAVAIAYGPQSDIQLGVSFKAMNVKGFIPCVYARGYFGGRDANARVYASANVGVSVTSAFAIDSAGRTVTKTASGVYMDAPYDETVTLCGTDGYAIKAGGLHGDVSLGIEHRKGFHVGLAYMLTQGRQNLSGEKTWRFENGYEAVSEEKEAGRRMALHHGIMLVVGWNINVIM